MEKQNRLSSRSQAVEAPQDPAPLAEPAIGDLPDALESSMPEAAREVPGTSSSSDQPTTTQEEVVMTEERACCTEDKPEEEADDQDFEDTLKLLEDEASSEDQSQVDSQGSILEGAEISPDHDTQELDEVECSTEATPRVEELQEQERKRPREKVENDDEVIPAKKIMSEVDAEAPGKTVGCEE